MGREEFLKMGVSEEIVEMIEAEVQAAILAKEREFQEEVRCVKVEAAVGAALAGARAKNVRAVRALLNLEGAEVSETGEVAGLAEQLSRLQVAEDSRFLFEVEGTSGRMKGAVPAEAGVEDADRRVDVTNMSYEELAAFLEANPGFEV